MTHNITHKNINCQLSKKLNYSSLNEKNMRAKTVSQRATKYGNSCEGDAENARQENAGRSKMQGWKMQESSCLLGPRPQIAPNDPSCRA